MHDANRNGIQTLRLLPARQAQHIDLKEDTQLSLPDVRVSSCACFGRGRLRPPRFHHCVSPPPLTCRRSRAKTWRTLRRTAAVSQAAAWTTKTTGLRSTGPILVAMPTNCHSKASICRTQRRPDDRTEVTKRRRRGHSDLWMMIDSDKDRKKKP